MPFTQTDVDTLRSAIALGGGVRSLTFSDQSVTFNSLSDMLALLARMEQDVAVTLGTRQSYRLAATRKGV